MATSRRGSLAGSRRRAALVPELPFDMPSRARMAATGRDVLSYYHTFPLYWRNNSNTYANNILTTSSPTYGGSWRQRPWPVVDNTGLTDAQRQSYMLTDVTNAANIGIDGFSYNVLPQALAAGTETWRWTEHMMMLYAAAAQYSAANTPGFKIAPDISMLAVAGQSGTLASATYWADQLSTILGHSAAYTRGGRPVVALYHVTQLPAQWYLDFWARLNGTYGINALMIPSYQGNTPTDLDPYVSGLFSTGKFGLLHVWTAPKYDVTPASIHSSLRAWATTNGVAFCGGIGPAWENDRPDPNLKEIEGYGVQVLQNQWEAAILNGDPMVKQVSWNDHEESHNIRPSTGYQWVPYDVTAYYVAKYKFGAAPVITRDALYYMHRMHLSSATYSTSQQSAGPFVVTNGPAVDKVLTLAMLTAPATVTVTTGGTASTHASAPAGLSTFADTFVANDTPTFGVTRNGVTVVPTFSSAFPTRGTITWQDLLYRMGSSTRPAVSNVQSTLPQDR